MTSLMPQEMYRDLSALAGNYWWHCTRRELIQNLVAKSQTSFRLYVDVGCGLGAVTNLIAQEMKPHSATTFSYVGIDHPDLAKQHQLASGSQFLPLDLEKVPQKTNGGVLKTFTPKLITCLDVVEHISEQNKLPRWIAAQMQPGDLAIFTAPAFQFLWSDWDVRLNHFRRYTKSSLKQELEASGLHVKECGYLFSWAVLPGILRAKKKQNGSTEFPPVPKWLNWIFRFIGSLEVRIARYLPFGTSVWATVEKGEVNP